MSEHLTIFPAGLATPEIPEDMNIYEKLAGHNVLVPEDIIKTYCPELNISDQSALQEQLAQLDSSELRRIDRGYILRLYELWMLKYNQEYEWEDFRDERLADNKGFWVYDRLDNSIRRTLPREDFISVFTSRLFPIFTREEIKKIRRARGFFLGLSTGSEVAKSLARLGLGSGDADSEIFAVDPDKWSLSNTRGEGTDASVGISKAIDFAHLLTRINPYIKFKVYPRKLSVDEIKGLMSKSDFVLEMTDNIKQVKWPVRELCRELFEKGINVPIFMGTNTIARPVVIYESRNDPYFLADGLEREQLNVVTAIGKENIPIRHMVNFILVAEGKMGFWAQDGASTSINGGSTALDIVYYLNGYQPNKSIIFDFEAVALDEEAREKAEEQLFNELCEEFPDVFNSSQVNLRTAVDILYQKHFG
jgi:hypothetical protein